MTEHRKMPWRLWIFAVWLGPSFGGSLVGGWVQDGQRWELAAGVLLLYAVSMLHIYWWTRR